ncbi:MAG: hypothetical protein GC145_18710 [Caulobacter sp.]|nr:hypothetical protein [Caulobacter sp.]
MEIFDLPIRMRMIPPAQIVVAMSQDGRRSTWTGCFTTEAGLPARSVVRLRHHRSGDAISDGGNIQFRLICGGPAAEVGQ